MINPRIKPGDKVLPDDRNSLFMVRVIDTPTGQVIEHPDLFGVTQRRSAGELSRFLIVMMKEARFIGSKCPKCHQILVPAFTWHCPNPECLFCDMEEVAMPDVGVMVASPVITYFPPADMIDQVPYAQGYVYLEDDKRQATTALAVPLTTRTGVIRPGVFHRDTPVKFIFRPSSERIGQMTDVAAIPISELTPDQIAQHPLCTSDIDWSVPSAPVFEEDPVHQNNWLTQIRPALETFIDRVNNSDRCRDNLQGLNWSLTIMMAGGHVVLACSDGVLMIAEPNRTDFLVAVEDPCFLRQWMDGGSLINGMASGELWLDRKEGVPALTVLDRLPRSLRREAR